MKTISPAIACCTLGFACAMMDGVYLQSLGGALLCGAVLVTAAFATVLDRRADRESGTARLAAALSRALPYIMVATACTLLPFLFTGGSPLSGMHPALHAVLFLLLCALLCSMLYIQKEAWRQGADTIVLSKLPLACVVFAAATLAGWILGVRAYAFAQLDSVALHATTAAFVAALSVCALAMASRGAQDRRCERLEESARRSSEDAAAFETCRALAKQASLSRREEEVLALLAQGSDTKDIESALTVSRNTVKTHVRNVYAKLEVHSRDELMQLVADEQASS